MGEIVWPPIVARLVGLVALGLGLLFWTGHALSLVAVHIACGVIVVLMLWFLAWAVFREGFSRTTVIMAIGWGLALLLLGLVQLVLPPGGGYGILRVLHLLVSLGAIAHAEFLGRLLTPRGPPER